MKTTVKIVIKCLFLCAFLALTPFFDAIGSMVHMEHRIPNLLYSDDKDDEERSLKEELNVLSSRQFLQVNEQTFTFETTNDVKSADPEPTSSDKQTNPESNGKRIYIYSTHQSEDYSNEATVMDASALLANSLQEKGYQVVVETNDFNAYARANGFDYNTLYQVSNKFINDAFVEYGGFDLVIDLHREATPRSAAILEKEITYAKVMCVIGGLAAYADEVNQMALTLTDIMNAKVDGIMKSPMIREAYYNQGMAQNMILIELGSNTNTFAEIEASIPVLAEGIDELLR